MVKRSQVLRFIPVFIVYVLIFKFLYRDNGFDLLMNVCVPIFTGILIAIILNPVIIYIETKIKLKNRIVAILITYLVFIGIVALLIILILPSIISSVGDFVTNSPNLIKSLNKYVVDSEQFFNEIGAGDYYIPIRNAVFSYTQEMSALATTLLNKALTGAINVLYALGTFLISIFISIYILYDKEHFENLFIKACHSAFEKKYADEIVNMGYHLYTNVTNFISGKLLDSLIIGILAYIGTEYLVKAPYALILSILIGVTNVIPYFGPFIGGIPAAAIVFLFDPIKGLWMGLFVLVLQQFDGWFLGPKILGVKLDLKPVWIIVAIIVGGGLFGPVGMFLATPFAALIKTFLDGYMMLRLKDKEIKLPHSNEKVNH